MAIQSTNMVTTASENTRNRYYGSYRGRETKGRGGRRGRSRGGEGLDVGGERGGVVVDAGGGAEGEGAGPGGDEALRVGVRDPGVAPVGPRPVVVELAHPPPPPLSSTRRDLPFSFPCVGGEAPASGEKQMDGVLLA